MTVTFDERTRMKLFREGDGHIHVKVPVICEGSTDRDDIVFIYDTGAYI
jgi:hypothetical protein